MRRQHWKTGKQDPTFAQNLHAKTFIIFRRKNYYKVYIFFCQHERVFRKGMTIPIFQYLCTHWN